MKDREVYQYMFQKIQEKESKKLITRQIQTLAINLANCNCAEFIEGCVTELKRLTENTQQGYRNHCQLTRIFHHSPADKIKEVNYLINSIANINDMSVIISLLLNYRQEKAIHGSSFESCINDYLVENSGIEMKYSTDSNAFIFTEDDCAVAVGADEFWQQLYTNITSSKTTDLALN